MISKLKVKNQKLKLWFLLFIWVFLCPQAWSEEIYLRDVSRGHWAESSIYTLIKLGATGGYPDGTFRGKREITRYEIAALLSKFAQSFSRQNGINEKLFAEMRSELASLKHEQERDEKLNQVSGVIESRAIASLTGPRGGRLYYRLKAKLKKEFDRNSYLKIGIDSVDAGFAGSSSRALATRLFDFEGNVKSGLFNYRFVLGPGTIVHTESDNFCPSLNNTVMIRPKSSLKISSNTDKLKFSTAYVTRQVATNGKIGVHEITSKIGYDFGRIFAHIRPRYLFTDNGKRNILGEVGLDIKPTAQLETKLLFSAGSFQDQQNGFYYKIMQKFKDYWRKGSYLAFRYDWIGPLYRVDDLDEYEYVYLNNFSRLIIDGTTDFGFQLKVPVTDQIKITFKSDYIANTDGSYGENDPGTYSLWQGGISVQLLKEISAQAFYQSYNVPSGIAQFSQPVPKTSNVIGCSIVGKF